MACSDSGLTRVDTKDSFYQEKADGADILWVKDMNPESGWKPVDETWPRVGDVFHLLDRKAHTYDPTDYVMPEGAAAWGSARSCESVASAMD